MDQIPEAYRGVRCVAVFTKYVEKTLHYRIRVGSSIQAIEQDITGASQIYPCVKDDPLFNQEPAEQLLSKFEGVNYDFIDLLVVKINEMNKPKMAKLGRVDSITIDDVLAMQNKIGSAKSKKAQS